MKALAAHPERQRLLRATVQYVEALRSWRLGHEITCLAHLYMGIEALTKAALREHLRKSGRSEDEAAVEWGVDEPDRLQRRKRIDGEARRRLIFRGDEECFTKARKVSEGFEHGYSDFSDMRKPAREVIVKTAEYLRRATIELIGIEPPLIERALGPKYKDARGPLNLVRYMRGTLIGKPEQLAAKDQLYPLFEWRTKLKTVRIGENGVYGFEPDETLTAKIGEDVKFHPTAFEVWDGSTIKPAEPAPAPPAAPVEPTP